METTPRIASATGVAVSGRRKEISALIKQAMENAVLSCRQQGITDPDEIRKRVMAARDAVQERPG